MKTLTPMQSDRSSSSDIYLRYLYYQAAPFTSLIPDQPILQQAKIFKTDIRRMTSVPAKVGLYVEQPTADRAPGSPRRQGCLKRNMTISNWPELSLRQWMPLGHSQNGRRQKNGVPGVIGSAAPEMDGWHPCLCPSESWMLMDQKVDSSLVLIPIIPNHKFRTGHLFDYPGYLGSGVWGAGSPPTRQPRAVIKAGPSRRYTTSIACLDNTHFKGNIRNLEYLKASWSFFDNPTVSRWNTPLSRLSTKKTLEDKVAVGRLGSSACFDE
ncbi:hypothetical protein B0T22DRAFT_11418 [Podospora appendiculata]|uniref:Uncharacterized protein n=1 Tax=Podospora appendiculata TaxID=314037 RepID=A0AAE1CFJ2_9PEZI|nr:hypothetical protein B0T22DRAFT_11418 [Podospora appendiculata]